MPDSQTNRIAFFEGKHIRKTLHADEWWFSIIDIVEVLVGGDRPRKYWNDLKKKLVAEGYSEVSEKIGQLKCSHQTENNALLITPTSTAYSITRRPV